MDLIRAFIAIEIPTPLQQEMNKVIQQFQRASIRGVRWVAANNLHLTLKFLGDTHPDRLSQLGNQLKYLAGQTLPFECAIGGLGAFPNIRKPRVIWMGLEIPQTLRQLQKEIEAEAAKIGCPPEERDFSPHLTLGRVGQNSTAQELQALSQYLSQTQIPEIGKFTAQGITLFRSDLRPTGSIYTPLFHADFKPANSTT